MTIFRTEALPTAIGSMPNTDIHAACSVVQEYLPEIPVWPQLPRRSFLENMYVQYSSGFPGIIIEGDRIYVSRTAGFDDSLEKLYSAYINADYSSYELTAEYAAGFHECRKVKATPPLAIKGQVVGPVSWGLTITDENNRPIIYDEVLADAVAKHLRLKAAWQENVLRKVSPTTIMFFDEPYLSSIGSALISVSNETVIGLLNEVFGGLKGLKGIHCCGNTDWSLLLSTNLDVLSFDAYNYGENVNLFSGDIKSFLNRGGIIAWGIVPTQEEVLKKATVNNLVERLEEQWVAFNRKGLQSAFLFERSLITPACGLASLSVELAAQALKLTSAVSKLIRSRYLK
ncbi:MAG: methionine synthase [Chloroflexi bacterium]|nr:methionine synthase [Chloroflexota bacterium]